MDKILIITWVASKQKNVSTTFISTAFPMIEYGQNIFFDYGRVFITGSSLHFSKVI